MAGLYHSALIFLIVLTIVTFAGSFWFTNSYGRFAGRRQQRVQHPLRRGVPVGVVGQLPG